MSTTQSLVTPADTTPPTSTWWVLATLSMLTGFAPISTDLYPSALLLAGEVVQVGRVDPVPAH